MFDNVVVGASASPSGSGARAVRCAAALAGASGGTVHIVTAFKGEPVEELLAQLRSVASETAVRVRTHPVRSDPVDAITRVAAEEAADLVVVGSQQAGGSRRLSSVPEGVMDRVECAVLVV
jgi:nucleotide-binding universal stress UspA family protein